MKKTYKNPTILVVKIQSAGIMQQTSDVKKGGSYNGESKIESRGSRFSTWSEDED